MLVEPYHLHEIHFAFCYRVYIRWQTLRNRSCLPLTLLNSELLSSLAEPYHIRILDCTSDESAIATLVSLQPPETISGCASKLKGQASKFLRTGLHLEEPTHLLSRGYFARTVGKSTREVVEQYLDSQGTHHGYSKRPLPPVFVETYGLSPQDQTRITAKHADVVANFHLVLSTRYRLGVFGSEQGRKVAVEWQIQQKDLGIAIRKVSFVPDHVHIAVRIHPAVSPADVVIGLMNSAQDCVQDRLILAGLDRLWEPSAYVGSYGEFTSPQIRKYIEGLK